MINCVHGIESAKIVVIDLIRNIIAEDVKPETITSLLELDTDFLPSPHIQFEILLYRYKKKHGKRALSKLIETYSFDTRHKDIKASYYITVRDLEEAYTAEKIKLEIEEQTELLATLLFQKYKGFDVIDTIREMDIDGINLGTSGALLPQVKQTLADEFKSENSVWVYYSGKHIHFRFLTLGTEDELRRIVLSLIRYGSKGSLTQNVGRVVATAPDKARITALCPPASECWAVFVRKFGFSGKTPEQLIIKPYTNNGLLAVALLEFLMKGMVTTAVTGRMGSGKTTLMTSIIRYINTSYNIHTLEMAFEMYLRDLYPERNVLAVQETPNVSASVLQDTLKKTDGAVSIVGEVATDDVAARMIQTAQVASLFTLFSHHAVTARDLVMAIRNSLVSAGGFSSMETAEKQVLDVLKIDVHMDYTPDGVRYIERITEIIPLPQSVPYPDYDNAEHNKSMGEMTREYYTRTTDRLSFVTNDILRYNVATNTYELCGWFSESLENHMISCMDAETVIKFRETAGKRSAV